jgi:O-antigen/teichoic acid export membrane protein
MLLKNLSVPHAMQGYQLMRVGSAVLSGILMAKMGLSLIDLGLWENLMFVASWVALLGVNGLLQSIAPLYVPADATKRDALLRLVFWIFTGIGFIMAVLVQLSAWYKGELGYDNNWLSLYLLLHVPTLPLEIVWMLRQRASALISWGLWQFGGQMAVIFGAIYLDFGITGALIGMALMALLRLIYTLAILRPTQYLSEQRQLLSPYLQLSWPLMANAWVGQLIALFDAWWVQFYWSSATIFAVFRYGSRELPIALALASALGVAMTPRLTVNLGSGLAELRQRSLRMMHWLFLPTIIIAMSAYWWFPAVFNQELAAAIPLFQIYLLITISRVLLPNSILIALGDTRSIFYVGWIELGLKIVLAIIFTSIWGLAGVAWSMVLCCWLEKIALAGWLWYRHGIRPEQWLAVRWFIVYAISLFSVVTWLLLRAPTITF